MVKKRQEKFKSLLRECREEIGKLLDTLLKTEQLVKIGTDVKKSYHRDIFLKFESLYKCLENLKNIKSSMNARIELLKTIKDLLSSLNEQQAAQLILISNLIPSSLFFKKLEDKMKDEKVKGEDIALLVKKYLQELEVKSKVEKGIEVIKNIGEKIGSAVQEAIKEHKD